MTVTAITLTGAIELIEGLQHDLAAAGASVSAVSSIDPPDMLNAPWTKAKVLAGAATLTVLLDVANCATDLAGKIADAVHGGGTDSPSVVIVIDTPQQSGSAQGVEPGSSAVAIQAAIDRALADR